jgi:hypothetical protein
MRDREPWPRRQDIGAAVVLLVQLERLAVARWYREGAEHPILGGRLLAQADQPRSVGRDVGRRLALELDADATERHAILVLRGEFRRGLENTQVDF